MRQFIVVEALREGQHVCYLLHPASTKTPLLFPSFITFLPWSAPLSLTEAECQLEKLREIKYYARTSQVHQLPP